MNASSILLKVGVSEICRRSFSIDVGGCDFGNMTIFAIFQRRGTIVQIVLTNQINGKLNLRVRMQNHAKSNSEYDLVPQIFIY